MTIPSKVYIIRISDPLSQEYAKTAAESCEKLNMNYEFIEGVENMNASDAWGLLKVKTKGKTPTSKTKHISSDTKASCATVSHILTWEKMIEDKVGCAVILEHDALMLHKPEINIPDNIIAVLGYKVTDPNRYDHVKAGPPKSIQDIKYHNGAHAYAITLQTAKNLIEEIRVRGSFGAIDNAYFMSNRKTRVPIGIVDPTPSIGWVRKSTIWKSPVGVNSKFINSFEQNYRRSK